MTIAHSRVSVGTAATVIAAASNMPQYVWLQAQGTASLYIGDATVTADTGFQIPKDQPVAFELAPQDRLFAISNASNGTAAVFRVTK